MTVYEQPRVLDGTAEFSTEHNLQVVYTQAHASTVYYSAIDANFQAGDSPTILDVESYLTYKARSGYIRIDGAGDIDINISSDGINFGNDITLLQNDIFHVDGILTSKIKLTHTGTDSAYRVVLV